MEQSPDRVRYCTLILSLFLFTLSYYLTLVRGSESHCRQLGGVLYFGKCYKFMGTNEFTFPEGERECKANGFDGLVQFQYAEEEAILQWMAASAGNYWTGVKYWNGQYRFRDGRVASVQGVENANYHSASLITHVRLVYEGQIPTLWFESLPDSTNQVICEYMYDDYCHQMKGHLLLGKCIRDIGNVETRQRAPDLCAHVGYQSLLAIDSEKEKKLLIAKLTMEDVWLDQQKQGANYSFSNGIHPTYNDILPTTDNGTHDSVYLSGGSYQVDHSNNNVTRNVVCQIALSSFCLKMHGYYYRGSCYRFYNVFGSSFSSARTACASSGYQLASIQSQDELYFLLDMISDNSTIDSYVRLDGQYNGTHFLDVQGVVVPFYSTTQTGFLISDTIVVNVANTTSLGQYRSTDASIALNYVCQMEMTCFGKKRDTGCGSHGRCVYTDNCICEGDIVGDKCQARERITFESRLTPLNTDAINDIVITEANSGFLTNTTHVLSLSIEPSSASVATIIGLGTSHLINLTDVRGIINVGNYTFAYADIGSQAIRLFNYNSNNDSSYISGVGLTPEIAFGGNTIYYGLDRNIRGFDLSTDSSHSVKYNLPFNIGGMTYQTKTLYLACEGFNRIMAFNMDSASMIVCAGDESSDYKQLTIDPITNSLIATVGGNIQIISPKRKSPYIGGGSGRFTNQISFSQPTGLSFSPDGSILYTVDGINKQLVSINMRCKYGYASPSCLTPICFGIEANDSKVCSALGVCTGPDHCVCNHPNITSPDCSQFPSIPMQITTLTNSVVAPNSGLVHPRWNDVLLFCDDSDTIKALNRSSGAISHYYSSLFCKSMTLTADKRSLIIVTHNFTIELIEDLMNPNGSSLLAGQLDTDSYENGYNSKIGVVYNIVIDPVMSHYCYFIDSSNGCIRRLDIINRFVDTLSSPGNLADTGDIESLAYYANTLGYMVHVRDKILFSHIQLHNVYNLDVNTMQVTKLTGGGPGNNDNPIDINDPAAYLDSPFHMSADVVSGDIYLTYKGKGIIKKISVNGLLTTFAGSYTVLDSSGSDISNATFAEISSTTFDPISRSLIIFEKGANQIREVKFKCGAGYLEDTCIPTCFGIESNSSSVCSGHGTCVYPDVCACTPGFSRDQCEYKDLIIVATYNVSLPPCIPMVISIMPISQSNQTFTTQFVSWFLESTILPIPQASQFALFLSNLHSLNITIPVEYLPMGGQTILRATINTDKGVISDTLTFNITSVMSVMVDAAEVFSIRSADDNIIYSKITIPKCVSTSRIQFHWDVDGISGSESQLLIPKRSFQVGTYLITLTIFLRDTPYYSSTFKNVNVLHDPPVVRIKGGDTAIRIGTNHTLDASGTYYPDDPNKAMIFTWYCNCETSYFCAGFINSGTAKQIFTPTIKDLYSFYLEINRYTLDFVSAVVTIEVLEEEIPQVSIVNTIGFVSTTKKLSLEAIVLNNVTSDVLFWWELSERLNNSTLVPVTLTSNQVLTSLSSRFLVLRSGVLRPSKTYVAKVSCRKRTAQGVGFAAINVTTSDAPFSSDPNPCTIIPQNNNKYLLLANGWALPQNYENNFEPLAYSFQYLDEETQRWTLISPYGSSNEFTTRLFPQRLNSTTQFACRVRNYYGEETISFFNYTLKSVANEDTFNEVLFEQLDIIQSSNGSISRDFGFSLVQIGKLYAELNITSNTVIESIIMMLSIKRSETTPPELTIQQMQALSSVSRKISTMSIDYKIDLIHVISYLLGDADFDQTDSIINNAGSTLSNMLSDTQTGETISVLNAPLRSAMKDLSQYLLGDSVPGEEIRLIQTIAFALATRRGYGNQLQNSTLTNYAGSSIYLPLLNQFTQQNEEVVYAIEYITFPDANSLIWRDHSNNISSTIISFKLLDTNHSKLSIEASNDDPLVITMPKLETNTSIEGFQSQYLCYFYDDSADMIWDTRGCWLFNETNTTVTCHCNHTTSFAAFIQYSKKDLAVNSEVNRAIYFVRIAFDILFTVIIVILAVFLTYHRNKQPIRSRIYAPLICLFALFVECALQGILRNALLSARDREKLAYPINIIGGIIITISCPLSIMSLYIYLWQNVRYFMLRKFYELMEANHGKVTPSRVMLIGKVISSKFILYTSSIIVLLVSIIYFLVLSTVGGVESATATSAATAITITSSVTYLGVLAIIGIGIVTTLIIDTIIWPLRRDLRAHREGSSKKNIWSEFTSYSRIYHHFRHDDPLYFRVDSLCISAAVIVGFVSFGIGIAAQYTKMEDNSAPKVVSLIFDLLFTALRIIAFGGALSVIRILFVIKKKQIQVPEMGEKGDDSIEDMILSLISSTRGLAIFKEFCLREFALENLFCIIELNDIRSAWSSMDNGQKQFRIDALFSQYIQTNAVQEVNIPGSVRKAVSKLKKELGSSLDNEQQEQIIARLHVAIMTNLSDTFSRFVLIDEYCEYIKTTNMHKQLEDINFSL